MTTRNVEKSRCHDRYVLVGTSTRGPKLAADNEFNFPRRHLVCDVPVACCTIILSVCLFQVKVKVKGLECKIPINLTIGTIPLRSVFGGPVLTPPPYQQDPEPFSLLWNQPSSPSTSSTSPSPWEPPVTPWDLPPSPPGYTPVTSPGPLAIGQFIKQILHTLRVF